MAELAGTIDGESTGCLTVEFHSDEIFRIHEKVDSTSVERYSLTFSSGNWPNYYGLVIMYHTGRTRISPKILNFRCPSLTTISITGI